MADKKMTVAEKLMAIKEELTSLGSTLTLDGEDFGAFLDDRATKSVKKSSGVHKLSAEKVELREKITNILEDSAKAMTCSEIVKAFADDYGEFVSTSLISGNLSQMLIEKGGNVVREMSGKTPIFTIAEIKAE